MFKKITRSAYGVALKIVYQEAKERRSLKPFKLLWKKTTYGEKWPLKLYNTTLVDYIKFCRINRIPMYIPEEELA